MGGGLLHGVWWRLSQETRFSCLQQPRTIWSTLVLMTPKLLMYPPALGRTSLYMLKSNGNPLSWIWISGRCGRKSFLMNTASSMKSSMIHSRLYSKGSSGTTDLNSKSRYSLRRHRCNRKKLVACELREANYWASENKNELTYFVFFLWDTEPNFTSSCNKQKCGSWLSKPSMMEM